MGLSRLTIKYAALSLILLLICQGVAISGQREVVTIATLEWPPYSGEKLESQGFVSAIITSAMDEAGFQTEFIFLPWKRAMFLVEKGKIDALDCAYYSKERARTYAISKPYAISILGFFTRKGDGISYKTLEDLRPYRIGVTLGYVNTREFDSASFLKKDTALSDELSLKKLLYGRVDLAVMDKFVGQSIINAKMPKGKELLKFMDKPLQRKPLYLLFSREKPGYKIKLEKFNKGLEIIKKNGDMDKILKKHGF